MQQGGAALGQPRPAPPQMPSFPGMLPDTEGKPSLPRGFSPPKDASSPESTLSDDDMEAARLEAEEEWGDIQSAFHLLEDNFGPDFQPLGPEHSQPIQTPFGPALQYRTFGIAAIWMNYWMARICCHRAHPSMPPAAMMAAGISAKNTEFYAIQIGKAAAGISPDLSQLTAVNPSVGAGLMESTFGLFVAGVQVSITPLQWLGLLVD